MIKSEKSIELKNLRYTFKFLFALIISGSVFAQVPVPAVNQENAIMLVGGIAHLGDGNIIQNSVIAFDKGKLTIVADATTDQTDRSAFRGY